AMRKSEGEYRESGTARDYTRERTRRPPPDGPLGLVPLLPQEVLAYYESVGKQIEVALGSASTRNIIFTGAVRGEGNSTVISQFAEMLSRRGERVVLVDGNP